MSKIGFNADIFMGKFDDVRYVNEMREEFNKVMLTDDQFSKAINSGEKGIEATLKKYSTKGFGMSDNHREKLNGKLNAHSRTEL